MGSLSEKTSHFNDWPNSQGFDVQHQESSPAELEVVGRIPAYAAGVLFRSGIGPRHIQTKKNTTFRVNHWFDSLSQVHRFQLHAPDEGHPTVRVTHSSRSTCDGLIARIEQTGERSGFSFGAKYDPCLSFFQKLQSFFRPARISRPDDASCSITLSPNFPGLSPVGEQYEKGYDRKEVNTLCNKTDSTMLQMLNPETLEPIGVTSQKILHPLLKGQVSAAHAEFDPITGDVYNFNLEFGGTGTYRVFTVSASTGKTSILATINHPAAYIHSLFLTKHYVILCVWSSFFTAGGASILWTKNYADALADHDPNKPTTWFVIDRGGKGLIATYESSPFFCFHTINAYEEASPTLTGETDIVADLTAYENLDCIKRFYIDHLASDSPSAKAYAHPNYSTCRPELRRFRLPNIPNTPYPTKPLPALSVFTAPKHKSPELPTVPPNLKGKKHRFVYGLTDTGKSTFFDGIVKYDLLTHEVLRWSEWGQTAGEPIFVRDPATVKGKVGEEEEEEGNDGEDKGVLLTVVLDGIKGASYLLVLDARTLAEVGRAWVRGDGDGDGKGVVGFGFHGVHVPAA